MNPLRNPANPNIKRNRAPEQDELHTLQSIIQGNQSVLDDLEKRIEDAQKRSKSVRQRYAEQLRVLEGIASEIHALDDLSKILREQKSHLLVHICRLSGIVHPIRRCPAEVLRHIFEWAVWMNENRWNHTAINISHVCRDWRAIALDASTLWKRVIIPLKGKPTAIDGYLKEMTTRSRGTISHLIIKEGEDGGWDKRVLPTCQNNIPKRVEHLEFQVKPDDDEDFNSVKDDQLTAFASHCHVDHIYITAANDTCSTTTDVSLLVEPFRMASSVTVRGIGSLSFNVNDPPDAVKNVNISGPTTFCFEAVVDAFPEVVMARLQDIDICSHSEPSEWSHITQLDIEAVEVPWGDLTLPSIETLCLKSVRCAKLAGFLDTHPSLKHLHIENDVTPVSIRDCTPRLVSLSITQQHLADCGMDTFLHSFVNLKGVTLYDISECPLQLSSFEELIRMSGLAGHQDNTVNRTSAISIPTLSVLVDSSADGAQREWKSSSLISSAVQKVSVVQRHGKEYNAYRIIWF